MQCDTVLFVMWNRSELNLSSIYFYKWNQQINSSSYRRETSTRFTFSESTKCHSSKQLSPRSQVPVNIPSARLPHDTAELSRALATLLTAQASATVSLLHKRQGDAYGEVLKVQWEKTLTESWKAGSQTWVTTWGLCNSWLAWLHSTVPPLCTESRGQIASFCFFRLIVWSKQGVCWIFGCGLWALLTNQGDDGLSTFRFHFCLVSQD